MSLAVRDLVPSALAQCFSHHDCVCSGAPRKMCSVRGCGKHAKGFSPDGSSRVCFGHGAPFKTCSSRGCTSYSVQGGRCVRHGARLKICTVEGCTKKVVQGGVCVRQ